MAFCEQCGARISSGAAFCSNCGESTAVSTAVPLASLPGAFGATGIPA
ncbi:zinc-ribbon domain-containing protein, partial [Paraburkholderia sp.]